jgi:hypothetical protein
MENAQQRGIVFERLLNDLFALDGLLVRESFTLKREGDGIVEQIDVSSSSTASPTWWKRNGGTSR